MAKTVLHAGCGTPDPNKLHAFFHGWQEVRLDIDPGVAPDIVVSITDLSCLAENTFDGIYTSHTLEHIYPHELHQALTEFYRVLKPKGVLFIRIPDLQVAAEFLARGDVESTVYASESGGIKPLDIIFAPEPFAANNTWMGHRTGFTADLLAHLLTQAGFLFVDHYRASAQIWAVGYKPNTLTAVGTIPPPPATHTLTKEIAQWLIQRLTPPGVGLAYPKLSTGPFAGLTYHGYPPYLGLENYLAKLSGSYDREIWPLLNLLASRKKNYSRLIMIGLGDDGYYPVGLATHLFPDMPHILCMDQSPLVMQRCGYLANLNRCLHRFPFGVWLDQPTLQQWIAPASLLFCDLSIQDLAAALNPSHFTALRDCDLIIKISIEPSSIPLIAEWLSYFYASHQIQYVTPWCSNGDESSLQTMFQMPYGEIFSHVMPARLWLFLQSRRSSFA